MQTYFKTIPKLLFVAFVATSLGLTSSLGQGSPTGKKRDNLRKVISDIANFHSETYLESLRYLFALSPNRFDIVLRSVTSLDIDESKGAQLLIRYIGDRELFNRMLKVCDSRCFLSGPVPLPLHSVDVKEIEYLLGDRDVCKLGEFEMKYIYAVFFDDTAPSLEYRRKVEERAASCSSDSITRTRINNLRTKSERAFEIESTKSIESLRINLFFLTAQERERAKIQFLGFNARKNRALFEILVDNGVLANRYFHVVFAKNEKNKWQFNSVTAVSQS